MKNQYYEEGYKAFKDDYSYFNNPYQYVMQKFAFNNWCEGWEGAEYEDCLSLTLKPDVLFETA